MAEIEGLLVRIEANTALLRQQLADAGDRVDRTTRRMDQSLARVDAAFARVGAAVAKVQVILAGAGIAAGLTDTAKAAMDFETAMAQVSTLLKDTSGIAAYAAQMKDLAKQFGDLPVEQAKGLYEILSAGGYSAANAMDVLVASNKLAIGGVTQVQVAADGLTSTLNAYGAAAGSAANVADAFFASAAAGKTSIADLAAYIGQVSPIAAQTGVTLDELLAAVAALTAGGIKTSTAMDGLRNVIAQVLKPSDEAIKVAKALGLQFNAAALQSKGLSGFLADVAAKTGGSSEMMAKLFGGVEALLPVMALTGTAAKDFAGALDDMKSKAGATDAAFSKMAVTSEQAMKRLNAQIVVYQTEMGVKLLAATGPAMAAISEHFNTVTKGAEGLAYALAISLAARAIPAAVGALKGLTVALLANPLTVLPATIALAAGALIAFRDDITPVADSLATLGDYGHAAWVMITDAATATNAVLSDMHLRMSGLGPAAELAGGTVIDALELLNGAVGVLLTSVKAWGNLFINTFVAIGALPAGVGEKIVTAFRQAFSIAADLASAFWRGLEATFSGDFSFSAFNTAMQADLLAPFRSTVGEIGTDLDAIFSQDRIGAAMGAAGVAVVQFGQTWRKTAEDIRAQQLFDMGQSFRSPDLPTPPAPPEPPKLSSPASGTDIAKMADWRKEITLSIAANERLAAATAKGAVAVEAATRQQEIEQQVMKLGEGARAEVTRLVNAEADARQKLALAQFIADIERETAAMTRLADAELKGVAAVEEANVQGKVAVELARQRIAAGTAEAKVIEEKIRALEGETKRRQQNAAIRTSQDDLAYARQELALMDQTEPARARALATMKLQQQAMRDFGGYTEGAGKQWYDLQMEIADTGAIKDYQQEIKATAKDIAGDWTETLYDALILKDKATSVIDGVKALGKRIALALLETNIVLPITTSIVGAAPGLFGISTPSGSSSAGVAQAGTGGLMQNASTLLSAGNAGWSILSGGAGLAATQAAGSFATSSLGASLGLSESAVGLIPEAMAGDMMLTSTGNAFVSGIGTIGAAMPYGVIGGIGGGLIGTAANSKALGAASGAALGAGAAGIGAGIWGMSAVGGPWGIAAAAIISAVMGALGTTKASVGPNAQGHILYENGRFVQGPSAADNGGDDSNVKTVTASTATGFNALADTYGLTLKPQNWGYWEGGTDKATGIGVHNDPAELVRQIVREGVSATDADSSVAKALASDAARNVADLDTLQKYLDVAAKIDNATAAFAEMSKTLDQVKASAKAAMADGLKGIDEEIKTADKIGLGSEYRKSLENSIRSSFEGAVQAATPWETAMATLRGETEAWIEAVTRWNVGVSEAEIRADAAAKAAKLQAQAVAEYTASLYDAQGRDFLTTLSGITDTRDTIRRNLTAVGVDDAAGKANTLVTAQLTSALSGLDLAQLADVTRTLGGEVGKLAETMRVAAQATATEDLTVRALRAQGRTDAAADLELRLQQERDYTAAAKAGYDTAYLAGLRWVQGLEAQAVAIERAAAAAAYAADIQSRAFAAVGRDRASQLIALDQQQAVELAEAQAAGRDVVQLQQLQAAERAAKAFQLAQADVLAALDQQITAQQDYATSLTNGAIKIATSARQFRQAFDSLALNDNSPLNAFDRLAEARRQAATAYTTYKDSSATDAARDAAQQSLLSLAPTLVQLAKGYYGSTDSADYDWMRSILAELGDVSALGVDKADEQLETAQNTLKELQRQRADAARLGERQYGALADLQTVLHQSYSIWQQALGPLLASTGTTSKPYGAPTDVQAAWDGLSAEQQHGVMRATGWAGEMDLGWNRYLATDSGRAATFESYVRQIASGTRYGAPANVQGAWDALSAEQQAAAIRSAGYSGGVDLGLNAWIQLGHQGAFESSVLAAARAAGIPGFAAGGIIPHIPGLSIPGVDSVPLIGMPGEGVVNLRGMDVLGPDGLAALNAGRWPANDRWSGNVTALRTGGGNSAASLEQRLDRAVSVLERIAKAIEDGDADNVAATGEVAAAITTLARQTSRAAGPVGQRRTANG